MSQNHIFHIRASILIKNTDLKRKTKTNATPTLSEFLTIRQKSIAKLKTFTFKNSNSPKKIKKPNLF